MEILRNVFLVVALIATLAGLWRIFEKAGRPGWTILIPFYSLYVFIRVAGRPGWWFILCFIPLVNLIMIVLPFDLAQRFGKEWFWGLGLIFLPYIFYPLLGFGDAQYRR